MATATMSEAINNSMHTTGPAATPESGSPEQHAAMSSLKLKAEDMNTFSPLSSSTITIASLGSSLGLKTPNSGLVFGHSSSPETPSDATSNYVQGRLLPADDEHEDDEDGRFGSIDEGFDGSADAAKCLGIRGISGNPNSYSSANMSSTVSDSSDGSIEMPAMGMRSVSADYTSAYGLHIRNSVVGGKKHNALNKPLPPLPADCEQEEAKVKQSAPLALKDAEAEAAAGLGTDSVRSSTRDLTAQRSLRQRLLRPLTWMQPDDASSRGMPEDEDEDVVAAAGPGSCDGGVAAAELIAENSSRPVQKRDPPAVLRNHLQRKSVAVVRQNGAPHPLSQDSTVIDENPMAGVVGTEDSQAQAVENVSSGSNDEPMPVSPSTAVEAKRYRAAPSKSLDISRHFGLSSSSNNRGPLSRRAMRRAKGEDAIYGGGGSGADVSGSSSSSSPSGATGPARFQALPRSLASRLGFASTLASRRQQGDVRFIVAPHPRFAEIVEVIDCDEMVPVYRKVSRSGKSWHETFHEVDADDEEGALGSSGFLHGYDMGGMMASSSVPAAGVVSDYDMACALGLPYPGAAFAGGVNSSVYSGSGRASLRNSSSYFPAPSHLATNAAASCVTFQSSASSSLAAGPAAGMDGRRHVSAQLMGLSNQSTASFLQSGTVRMARGATSMGMYGGSGGSENASIDKGLLWEALTPYPNQFPLHIKGARTVEDSISLASLVLDRQLFCYRFQLGNNKMRWTAKRVRKNQLAIQCFVRSYLVAEVFVDYELGYSPYNTPLSRGRRKQNLGGVGGGNSNSSSGISTPMESSGSDAVNNGLSESTAVLPDDGTYPIITVLPAAFTQLSDYDSGLVESFIVFSGMQMLECLHV